MAQKIENCKMQSVLVNQEVHNMPDGLRMSDAFLLAVANHYNLLFEKV